MAPQTPAAASDLLRGGGRDSVLTIRMAGTDPEPILVLDGEDLRGDDLVTLPARAVAALAYQAALSVFGGGRRRKRVERDSFGQIRAIVDEPDL